MRKEPWDDIEWQEHWDSLKEKEQTNLNRSKSHCIKSLQNKLCDMADTYNASAVLVLRFPNGAQHTKYILASGHGLEYKKSKKGELAIEMWERHWNKKQSIKISNRGIYFIR